jgi:Holliday junction DNA helicase RuvB
VLGVAVGDDGAHEIARRSRGTPRIAGRLLRRVRDFAAVADAAIIDALDRRYLACIAKTHEGGPVGIETIAAALSEPRDALEEIIEPYLLQQGFISRTPRGRVVTLKAYRHLGLSGPQRLASPQAALFDIEASSDEDDGETQAGTG